MGKQFLSLRIDPNVKTDDLSKRGPQMGGVQKDALTDIRIVAVGDIALNGGYNQLARRGSAGTVASAIAPLLSGGDLIIGNLETPLTTHPRVGPPWRFCLHGDPGYASALRAAGFHVLSLANNHMMDHGWQGAEETIRCLKAAGILHVGAGRNLDEARKPAQLVVNRVRVAILAYCDVSVLLPIYADIQQSGVAPARRSYILEDVAKARRNNELVIVCMHWGQEYVRYPAPKYRRLAREMISAGANLIIGHHPHVLQGIECIDRAAVAYSLGNFTFSEEEWVATNEKGETFSMSFRINEISRRTAVWHVGINSRGLVTSEYLNPAYLGQDLCPVPDSRPEPKRAMDQNRKALVRPAYELFWTIQLIHSRVHAILDQFGGAKVIGKRLLRLRPRHFTDIKRVLIREWQQLRGSDSK
jgi:hypothetical protein